MDDSLPRIRTTLTRVLVSQLALLHSPSNADDFSFRHELVENALIGHFSDSQGRNQTSWTQYSHDLHAVSVDHRVSCLGIVEGKYKETWMIDW